MDIQALDNAIAAILAVIPNQEEHLARVRRLITTARTPTVTVIGKYNHGKSRLLNELIGEDIFSVADKRETISLQQHTQQNIYWLDAPGLDADVAATDDDYAHEAVWIQADIRLFIHSVKEGELDAAEQQLLQQLIRDKDQSYRQTLLVLTQIDQVPDQDVLAQILKAIQSQVPQINALAVSATRHRQGVEQAKALLIEKSGIAALQQTLSAALAFVPTARSQEKTQRFKELRQALQQLHRENNTLIMQLKQKQAQQQEEFIVGLKQTLDNIRIDLAPIVDVEEDGALVPDSFATMFKNTAAKQQRAKVQIAYSGACIAINSHLIRHGVVGLPKAQQTNVKSIDSVIVAVLGISVKFRAQLRHIFYSDAERERLMREFNFYFEQSAASQALVAQVTALAETLVQIEVAQAALERLEDAATC